MTHEHTFYLACFLAGFTLGMVVFRIARRLRWSRMPRIPRELPAPLRSMTVSDAVRNAAKLPVGPRKAKSVILPEIDPDFRGWNTPPREDRTAKI